MRRVRGQKEKYAGLLLCTGTNHKSIIQLFYCFQMSLNKPMSIFFYFSLFRVPTFHYTGRSHRFR